MPSNRCDKYAADELAGVRDDFRNWFTLGFQPAKRDETRQ